MSISDNLSNITPIVLLNGSIYTLDPGQPWVQALTVSQGKIAYVGSNHGAEAFIGPTTTVIDLQGKMVLPGFVDSHAHPSWGIDYFSRANLYSSKSLEEYRVVIRTYSAANLDLEVIRGAGWANSVFPGSGPNAEMLDDIEPERPVILKSKDGHSLWVNSKALEMSGINKNTPDPPGGVIERFPKGSEPAGTLRESAMDLVLNVFPQPNIEEYKDTLLAYQAMAGRIGITLVHDAMLDIPAMEALHDLAESGQLRMRFRGAMPIRPELGPGQIQILLDERSRHTHPLFQIHTAKIFVDGVVSGCTGYLMEPYRHLTGYRGEALWEEGRLDEICQRLDQEGVQIHLHAIGDAAVHQALDAIEYAQWFNRKIDSRHLITHMQLVQPGDIPRFRELGIVGIPQPFWFQIDDYHTHLAVPYLGEERAKRLYPMRSFFEAGVVMASSSDFPVTIPCDPLIGIQRGITRSNFGSDDSPVLYPEERVSLEEMIASFTVHGAYANFLEHQTGSLEVGKFADLVVLDQDLYKIPPSQFHQSTVLLTLAGGEKLYRAPGFE